MKKHSTARRASLSLNLAIFESAITSGLLAMSIMTPFFNSIGLNQEEIAITQGVFTVVVSILNIPAGWVADRFGRKWANVIGDFGCFITLLCYSQVTNMMGAIMCECSFGLFLALSQGVDNSLIRHFSQKIVRSEKDAEPFFKSKSAQLALWQYVYTFVLVFLGGPIGAINFRLAIACSSISHLAGAIAGIFIYDDSERLQSNNNPLKDMGRIVKTAMKNPPLRHRIFAYAVGREMTHGIIWVVTPLFLSVGVPLSIVSAAWAINSCACILGSWLATKCVNKLSERWLFAIPLILMTVSMGTLGIRLNIYTIWVYFLMGIVQGWTASTLLPMAQRYIKPAEQTSVISLAKVSGQVLYIPIVWIIGHVADMNLQYAPAITVVIFLPLGLLALKWLKK